MSLTKKNVCTFKICDGKIKLPCGFSRLLALRLGSGSECSEAIYADMRFIESCGCGTDNISSYLEYFEIDNGYIHFHGDVEDISEVTIAYLSFNMDENGMLLGQTDYERGITAYICWKFTQRNFQKYPQYIQRDYYKEWKAQKRWVRSGDFQKSFQDTKAQIREWANALVVQKTSWEYNNYPTSGITTTISE